MARQRRARATVVEPKPTPTPAPAPVTGGITLHVDSVCMWLQSRRIEQLDGLFSAVSKKLKALGHGPRSRAHHTCKMDAGVTPTGDGAGIIRFVEHAIGDEDIRKLQTLEAVMAKRFKDAGYTPKKSGALT